jgi:hypothetical protein
MKLALPFYLDLTKVHGLDIKNVAPYIDYSPLLGPCKRCKNCTTVTRSIITLSITTFNITMKSVTLGITTLNHKCHYAECHAECHYTECHYSDLRGASKTGYQSIVKPTYKPLN